MSLLCVLSAAPRTPAQVSPLARRLLSMRPCADALLLLCDLPDAFSEVMPEDAPLLRALQSAVMAADARCPGHFLLLVRKRVWDDAARLYLGENQPLLPMQTVAALLAHGHAPSAFAAASFSPASLAGQFSAALFCPADVSCAPDVPRRMLAALGESGLLAARILPPLTDNAPLSNRLPGFSFWESRAASDDFLARRRRARLSDGVLLASSRAFSVVEKSDGADVCPLWDAPAFVADASPSLRGALCQTRRDLDRLCRLPAPTGLQKLMLSAPPLRLLLLFFAAVSGWEWVAVLALLEPYALLHPRMLPAALVRLAFLPMTALCAANAFFAHRLARSPLLRVRFPKGAQTPAACAVCGAALLPAAFLSLRALAPLLFVSLLWLAAPPLFRALALRRNQTLLTLHSLNMLHSRGFLAEVFGILARHNISVDLITTSEVSVALTLDTTGSTSTGDTLLTQSLLMELSALCRVEVEEGLALVALIGNDLSKACGVGKEVFGVLEPFNIRMICYGASSHNLCFLVPGEDAEQVVQKLHSNLFE